MVENKYLDILFKSVVESSGAWVEVDLKQVEGETVDNKRANLRTTARSRHLWVIVAVGAKHSRVRLYATSYRERERILQLEAYMAQVEQRMSFENKRKLSKFSRCLLAAIHDHEQGIGFKWLSSELDCPVDRVLRGLRKLQRQGLLGIQAFYYTKQR